VILSDLSPRLSGVRDSDEARAAELIAAAVGTLPTLLRSGGHLLLKLFMNSRYRELVGTLGELFVELRTTRPEATRHGSAELYAIAKGYRARDAV
jgi:23S rRNA (uridine2552-2'-O)-methyltransferase